MPEILDRLADHVALGYILLEVFQGIRRADDPAWRPTGVHDNFWGKGAGGGGEVVLVFLRRTLGGVRLIVFGVASARRWFVYERGFGCRLI